MPKKIIQDIIINPVRSKTTKSSAESLIRASNGVKKKRGIIKWLSIIFAIIIAIVLGKIILTNVSSATIKITPRQEFIDIDSQLKLGFEIMQIEHEESQIVPATGISKEGQKARGRIVIYNTYSSSPQKLVSQTRFETPDGKIYRIQEQVSVPGNDSLEATVYADKPGPEYNIGLVDFTIPGFKGTPRYEKIYGRSKTEMKGGALGTSQVVSEEDIKNTRNNLKQKIENYLKENLSKQKPDGYLLYKNAVKIDFSENLDGSTLAEKGKAVGFLIKKNDLSKVLAENYISAGRNDVNIINLDELKFNLLSGNTDDTEITFNLKGRGYFVWNVDADSLVRDLMNAKDKNYTAVFSNYPNIEKAEIIFKPSWWHSMPSDKSGIYVETIYK
jgi:hypothetical protein